MLCYFFLPNIAASVFLPRGPRDQKHSFTLVALMYCLLTRSIMSCPLPATMGTLEDTNMSIRETLQVTQFG